MINTSLKSQIQLIKNWYSEVTYHGQVYGVTKEIFNNGQSVKLFAEQLWGEDFISCNRYETRTNTYLRPCEMSEEKVADFILNNEPFHYKSNKFDMNISDTSQEASILTIWLGCFWGVQSFLDWLQGVIATQVWYAWWTTPQHPTYETIGNYTEAVQVIYNPQIINLGQLFNKISEYKDLAFRSQKLQYKYTIRYTAKQERDILECKKDELQLKNLDRLILLDIAPQTHFEKAEDYHQKYYLKHGLWSVSCKAW